VVLEKLDYRVLFGTLNSDTQAERTELTWADGSSVAVLWQTGDSGFGLPAGTTAKDIWPLA
jgi:hypothetical protein